MSKKKLKIGVVIDQLLPGGVQIAAIEEVKNLRQLGVEAELLILMRKKYSFQFQHLTNGIPYKYLSDSYPWPFRNTVKFPIFAFFSTLHLLSPFLAPRVIKEKAYDLLISHGTTTCFTTLSLWRRRKIPYAAIIHDPIGFILKKVYTSTPLKFLFPFLIPLSSVLEKAFVKEAALTMLDSNVHQEFIQENYQTNPVILPLGCKVASKIPAKRGHLILAFSRWQKEKNPLFLLKILKEIPKVKLRIAGVWTKAEDLLVFKKQVLQLNLEDRVEIIPQFSDRQLSKFCNQARVWVHPNFEAFGMAGLEAASMGCPIIIPSGSGVANLFRDKIDGFFPEKITVNEYIKYIRQLLDNERLAYAMGKNAWNRIKKEHSWQAHTKKLLKLVNSSLKTLSFPKITCLEISHAGQTGLSGGDKLFEEMVKRMPKKYRIEVITSPFGAYHWQKAIEHTGRTQLDTAGLKIKNADINHNLNVDLLILKPNSFEKKSDPVSVFLSYCNRITQASLLLIRKRKKLELLYSSTNILPDVLPAFLAKLINPKVFWVARIHHLIPHPRQREGRFVVNIISYSMQLLALYLIKLQANLTIALNETLYRHLLLIGFPKDKLSTLGAGIDFKLIANYKPLEKKGVDGIYLGRLHIAKGILDAAAIWNEVVSKIPHAHLAIIGAGPEYILDQLKAEIQKLKLGKNIKILGFLPQNQVFNYLKSAKVFLFTDHEAGWGLAIGEAMAAGLPVIGYQIEGVFGDVYKQGYQTVAIGDTQDFARKVIDLLTNEQKRQQLAKLALIQAKNLSWEKTTKKFLKLVTPLVN